MRNGDAAPASYDLAPMSPLIRVLTLCLLALPAAFILAGLVGVRPLPIAGVAIVLLYIWIWLRYRPSRFEIHQDRLTIIWPQRRAEIPLADIAAVRVLDKETFREETGWRYRIGVGGLWGVFGWFRTRKRGAVRTYISRFDGLVWIERDSGRPWLLSPERPESFAEQLLARMPPRS